MTPKFYYSASQRGFFDDLSFGPRKLIVQDPAWVCPEIEVPDEAAIHPMVSFNDGAVEMPDPDWVCPMIKVPDPAAEPDMIEVDNPDCRLPEDGVEVPAAEHKALMIAQASGKIIVANKKGYPVAAEPPPLTNEELDVAARRKRDRLIDDIQWRYERYARQNRLGLASSDDITELDAYVQALADVTTQPGYPASINWPTPPE
ncbi:MAG: hypothetical protein GC184_14565 [Rhizobiales bacterium]|nr:hypothetical protein [Hyphomicrobiales bacterium]